MKAANIQALIITTAVSACALAFYLASSQGHKEMIVGQASMRPNPLLPQYQKLAAPYELDLSFTKMVWTQYHHHPGAYLAGTTVTPGAMLVPVNAKSYLSLATTHATSATETPNESIAFVVAGTTACLIASSTFGNTYKVFIRAM
jgi:hypothetical protein